MIDALLIALYFTTTAVLLWALIIAAVVLLAIAMCTLNWAFSYLIKFTAFATVQLVNLAVFLAFGIWRD